MNIKLRPSGIEGLGEISWGTHFCLFYETKEDLLDFFIPFFKAGLEQDAFCLCVASEPLIAEEAERAMRQAFPDFERYLAEGQVEITPHTDWYLKEGHFDEQRVLQGWIEKLDQALAKGFSGLRFAANILLEQRDWASFAKYEGKLEDTLRDLRIEGMCAYNLNRYSAANVIDIVRHHQFALARRDGVWETLEGPELVRAHEEIRKLNADLEHRVIERTAQLAAANEQLRREIAEHKRSEEARRASEARLQAAIDAAHIGLWDWDLVSGQIIWLGHHEKLFGFAPGEFDGTYSSFEKRVHPEDLQELNRVVQRARDQGSEYIYEYRIIWPDGSIHWIAGRGRFAYNETGQPVRMYGAVIDITERKQAEEAIRKSEQVLREAESLGHTGSWEQNLVTGEIFNTGENLRLFFGDDHNKGADFEDYAEAVHPDDREYVMQRRVKLLAEGGARDIEYRVVWPDGSVHVIFGRATVVYDELGQALRVYGTNVDITERKQAEEAFRLSEQRFQLLTETIPILVWSARADGVSDYYNAPFLQYLGRTLEEMHGWAWVNTLHPDDRERSSVVWTQAFSSGSDYEIEYRIRRAADGQYRWHLGRAVPLRDSSGTIVRWYGTCTDIHDRKRAEEEMNWHAARAETLARIAARLNKQLDLEAVIHAVCEEAINTFKVSQATMSLYDKKRDLLVYAGGVNIPPEYAAIMEPITRSQFDDFFRAMGPIMVIPDIQSVSNVPNIEFSSHLDVRTVVTAAMLRDQELVGVLVVGVNGHVREFDKDELTLLKAISDQAAQAIANALLLKAANEQHEQLRALSTRLVEVQESERTRLAREIHDDIGQSLTALMMQLGTAKSLLPKSAKSAWAILEQTEELIGKTLERTRLIIADLRPQVLDDLGLVPALRRLGDELHESTGAAVKIKTSRLPKRLPAPIEVALFRIVQEALANVRKHAQARHVTISLAKEPNRVVLSVQDDGIGFEKQTNRSRENGDMVIDGGWVIPNGHFGLIGIQERVTQLGGKLQVTSAPGQGTTLRVELPLGSESNKA